MKMTGELFSLLIGIGIGVCLSVFVVCVAMTIRVHREGKPMTVWQRVRTSMLDCKTDDDARAVYAEYLLTETHAASNMQCIVNREGDNRLDKLFSFLRGK